jgi:hypothetical protein
MDSRQYWRKVIGISPIGESIDIHWRKISGNSPIGENTGCILAKDQWTFANGESPVCEILIGELPATQNFLKFRQVSFSFLFEDSCLTS